MIIHKNVLFLIEAIAVIVIVAAVGLLVWWLFGKDLAINDTQLRANLIRMQASAETYYSRLQFYDGMCSDIGIPPNFTCNETTDSFAIETRLSTGRYLCVDNSGFLGEIPRSKGGAVSCTN